MTREEAIEVVKKNYPHVSFSGSQFESALRELVPELAESKDERIVNQLINLVNSTGEVLLIPTNKEELVSWLEKQQEQKPAEWSEEDEKMLNDCIMALSNWRDAVANYGHEVASCQKLIDWLKSLRPQYHGDVTMTEAYKMGLEAGKISSWKPSEEQVKALKYAAYHMLPSEEYRDMLFSLFKDLKKLM